MRMLAPALLALAMSSPAVAVDFPESVTYRGRAVDAAGSARTGAGAVEVQYFDADEKLLTERFQAVSFSDGSFALTLGRGAFDPGSAYSTFKDLAAHHPALQLAFRIDGVDQSPRVKLLPAGHSPETRAILAGAVSANDSAIHSRKWRAKSGSTAIQAAILRPGVPLRLMDRPGAEFQQGAMEIEVYGPSLSIPVRDMPTVDTSVVKEVPDREINPPRFEDLLDENGNPVVSTAEPIVDELAARSLNATKASPSPLLNFAGIGNVNSVLPPDTEGVVGTAHYLQVVNLSFAIYNKSDGSLVSGPVNTNTLWSGFGGHNCASNNDGDAIFLYDRYADRWVLSQFSVSTTPEAICLAISATGDPTGAYYRYSFAAQRFPDYFKLGTWPDASNNAWFMGTNSGFSNQYDVYAIDRENMLLGNPARPTQFFQDNVNLMMPADATSVDPPPGAGGGGLFYTMRSGGEPRHNTPLADSLDLWQFHVDWTTPANSTWTMIESFTNAVGGLADFNWAVCGFFVSNCLDQPTTAQGLDSASWWPMKRLVYMKFDDHESLVGSWTVDVTGTPDLAGIRWFELRRTVGDWSIYQQGTFTNGESGASAAHRWMPSIAMDGDGGIAVGYSVMKDNGGSSDLFASIRYAVRAAGDPLGTLQSEADLFVGTGAQTHSAARWGDYSSMSVDPVDNCTFWYTNEYLATTGSAPWVTRIGSFKIPGCGGLAIAPTAHAICTLSTTAVASTVTVLPPTFLLTTDLSITGCPGGATCSFSDDPIVNPDDNSVLTLSGLGAVAAGVYNMDVTATDSANPLLTRTAPLKLTTYDAPATTTTLVAPANGAVGVPTAAPLSWTSVGTGISYEVQVDNNSDFLTPEFTTTVSGTSTVATGLGANTLYYWRVRATNLCGGSFTAAFTFRTALEYCSSPNLAIPDNGAAVTDAIVVPPGAGFVTDLDVSIVGNHSWVGDLIFRLKHDAGAYQVHFDRPGVPTSTFGCSSDGPNMTLSDEAGVPVETACPSPFNGTFTPSAPLSVFDGQSMAGTWTLQADDDAGGDTGSLQQWCLHPTVDFMPFGDGFESGNAALWSSTLP